MNKQILENRSIQEMIDVTQAMYAQGWAERNGGNVSIILDSQVAQKFLHDNNSAKRICHFAFDASGLANRFLLVTGSGKYFRNTASYPEENLGIIKILADGSGYEILWGLINDAQPTSELPAHLMSHMARMKINPEHRVIIHTHATNTIAMTFVHDLNDDAFTKTLWQMCSESLVVFPEGVAVLPWMVPGKEEIGAATAEKMKQTRLVVWPFHGIFGAGCSVDEAFGLIETVEKSAKIYLLMMNNRKTEGITNGQLKALAIRFNVKPKAGVI